MFFYIYYVTVVITFLCCLKAHKKFEKNYKWFTIYFGFVVVYEFFDMFNWLVVNHTNAWCANVEELIEFVLFTYFMTSLVNRTLYKNKVYRFAFVLFLFSLINMGFIQGVWRFNTISMTLQGLFILTLICIYYYNLFDEAPENINLIKHPPFLVSTGLLFYYLAKSFYYICYSYMAYKNNYHFYLIAKTIPATSNILLNSLLIYAFLLIAKTKKPPVDTVSLAKS